LNAKKDISSSSSSSIVNKNQAESNPPHNELGDDAQLHEHEDDNVDEDDNALDDENR